MPAPTSFPTSAHCDGARFFNPRGPAARSFWDLPKWWWQQARGSSVPWPRSVPPPRRPALPATVPAGRVAATFVGHATFLLQFPHLTVLTDPVFGRRAGPFGVLGPPRIRPPALRLDELPAVPVVVLSHNHYDHLDLAALRWLHRHRRPWLLVPLGLGAWLADRGVPGAVELDWWQSHRIDGLEVVLTPAQHWSSRWPWDRCRTLWGGFLLRAPGTTVFFAGDSGWGPHFAEIGQRLGPPDIAILPIGAYEPRWFMAPVHLNPDEAVRAHRALGARASIGMHFGTWKLTDEGIDEPVNALAAAREAHRLPAGEFDVLEFGETRLLGAGQS